MIGKTIGKYLIQEELGGGSTAFVYKGYQRDIGRTVAVKILHPHLVRNTTIVERFRRESQTIAALVHPHIVRFYDYVEDAEHFLYVMEYLNTYTLENVLEKKTNIPLRLAIPIIGELCDALAYAHSLNIIHRDIKPSNLFIARGKGVILTDFGLAKPLGENPITAVGSKMLGTPFFMAPEQVTGDDTDVRTDLYQVGLIFYQVLTGQLAFYDKSHFKMIMARTQGPAVFSDSLKKQIPGIIRDFISRATAVRPGDRFQSAIEMRRVLAEIESRHRDEIERNS